MLDTVILSRDGAASSETVVETCGRQECGVGRPVHNSQWRREESCEIAGEIIRSAQDDVAPSYYGAMNTRSRGKRSITDAGWLKLVARISTGLPAIHCERSIAS
jgi:hypothetical protein